MDLIHIVWGIAVFALSGWNYMQQQQNKRLESQIEDLDKTLTDVRIQYVHKDELKDLKEFIGKGFDKLETQLSTKMDKDR